MTLGKFHHYGVPTDEKQPNEVLIEGAGVHVTDPDDHPFRVEFLRFEEDSCMPPEVQSGPHAAFMVEDLEEALTGRRVVLEPFDATPTLRVAFVMVGQALIEVMQEK